MNNVRYDVLWGAEGPPARGNYTRSVPSAPVFDAQPTSSEAHYRLSITLRFRKLSLNCLSGRPE